jgi:hypothetical protein
MQVKLTVTVELFHPAAFGDGEALALMPGVSVIANLVIVELYVPARVV